ncbi:MULTISPECIES: TonB-dependent receptor [unclassified Undibacterium]|uniref:TonB-dependent receptor n=1 Tax=unclassified Undibacterium TaxID=2630295 RepID=UPI002AC89757|nr:MULTISPECIES: TonB-dependent receptor [unclassified Undibacterium]MEB0139263.1 TonB-dependent receptor [Undibacterium sp. CCC2.1]MEB0172107.1 TonB-dependent receptor [Undibacterium sp. CCC1.1]MEB0175982.1 TonB-dependent receptor [Undibacterium sp. CCC3.4]MEB0215294.1 TonB-dependent receptor [Undibacterium sp. 5I2]WPX45468.1 TonB-dependent receptor [Undibacterium sp. CCC3.4]
MTTRPHHARKHLGTPIQLAVLSLIAGLHSAQAQEQNSAAQQNKAAADSNTISEVLVTGTKRSTSLQRTPVAITAINAAALEDAHVQTIQDVVNLVPGFSATAQGDHGVITMTIRGVGNDSAKTEYADPEVATFVNGIYAPRPEGATTLLFDMEGIEVLRGPQGTLWGRNASVGAVNMQTAKPILGEQSGNLEGGLGSFKRSGVRGAFNLPVSDTMALRFAFVKEAHDGYVDYQTLPAISLASQKTAYAASNKGSLTGFQALNPNLFVTNGPKYGAQDQSAARLSMLWKPTTALTWNVSYEKYTDRGTPNMNLMQTPRTGQNLWSALIDTAPYVERDSDSLRSRMDLTIGDSMSLSYIAGYSKFSGSSRYDQDGGAAVPTSFTTGATHQENNTVSSNYVNYSHELELQSTGKRDVDWLLGLYYGAETNDIRFDIPIINGTQQGSVGWQGSFIQPKETVESSAAFGQATWNVSDRLHLTGGLRYTSDKRTNVGGNGYTWNGDANVSQTPLSGNINPTIAGQGYSPSSPSNDGTYTGSKVTSLARISYDFDQNNMIYASYSTGYKSGGLQDGGKTYGAETLANYEIGSKHTFLGGTVKMNNALYFENFKGFQFSAPVTNPDGSHTLATSNADGAKIAGFETEIAAKLSKDDKVQVSLAYTPKATLGKLIGGSNDYALPKCVADPTISTCVDVTGFTMPHTPKIQIQVQYQHSFHLAADATLTPRISVHYESESGLSVFSDYFGAPDKQAAYARTDLGLRYARNNFYIDAFVRNASNSNIKTSAQNGFSVWQAQYLAPRTFGFNTGVDF